MSTCFAAPPFFNGINLAWIDWSTDFLDANNVSAVTYCGWEEAIRFTKSNGGNAVRVWLFTDPQKQLEWDADGLVSGLVQGTTLQAQTLLALAEHYDVRVVLVLFNGANVASHKACTLFSEARVLDSLLERAVRPLVTALTGHRSLSMLEIINEPEGLVDPWASSAAAGADPVCESIDGVSACAGANDAPGWNQQCIFPLAVIQRFINRVAGAIRISNGLIPLTVGSWNTCSAWTGAEAEAHGGRHLFSDSCLIQAGGDMLGTIDVHQVHAYPKERNGTSFAPSAAVSRRAHDLGIGEHVLLGEISSRWDVQRTSSAPTSSSFSTVRLHTNAVSLGYSGVFSWAYVLSAATLCLPP